MIVEEYTGYEHELAAGGEITHRLVTSGPHAGKIVMHMADEDSVMHRPLTLDEAQKLATCLLRDVSLARYDTG